MISKRSPEDRRVNISRCRFENFAAGFFRGESNACPIFFLRPRIPRYIHTYIRRFVVVDSSLKPQAIACAAFRTSFCRVYRSPFSVITCHQTLSKRSPFTVCAKDARRAMRARLNNVHVPLLRSNTMSPDGRGNQ